MRKGELKYKFNFALLNSFLYTSSVKLFRIGKLSCLSYGPFMHSNCQLRNRKEFLKYLVFMRVWSDTVCLESSWNMQELSHKVEGVK